MACRRRQQGSISTSSPLQIQVEEQENGPLLTSSLLSEKPTQTTSVHDRNSSLSSACGFSALKDPKRCDSISSESGGKRILARRAKAIVDHESVIQVSEAGQLLSNSTAGSKDDQYGQNESPELQRREHAITTLSGGLNVIGNRTACLIQGRRKHLKKKSSASDGDLKIAENQTADLVRKTCRHTRKKSNASDVHSRKKNRSNSWQKIQNQTDMELQLEASHDVAMAIAAKAKLLVRELKTIKGDLASAEKRCTQLEEENTILRQNCNRGDRSEDDEMDDLKIVENRPVELVRETDTHRLMRRKSSASDVHNQENNCSISWQQPQMHSQIQTNLELQLKASRDVAMAMAAKVKLLRRELKAIKGGLAFAEERCVQLEEENEILRRNCNRTDQSEDDEMGDLKIVKNRTTDFVQETRKHLRKKSSASDEHIQEKNCFSSWQHSQMHSQNQTELELQLQASRDVAMAVASKAKLLVRELKTIKDDLASADNRCAQLEEENKILRQNRNMGDHSEDDEMIWLQFETLLAEKARLTHENSVYARENRFLREVIEYYQFTMENAVYFDQDTEISDLHTIRVPSGSG